MGWVVLLGAPLRFGFPPEKAEELPLRITQPKFISNSTLNGNYSLIL
jgi:hypothetical protein